MAAKTKMVEIEDVEVVLMTTEAILCRINDDEVWIPLSQLGDNSEVFDDEEHKSGTLVIPEWLAIAKNVL